MSQTTPTHQFVKERFVILGTWTARSALHTGGDSSMESSADMQLLRDRNGKFFIPGSSLAGAARSYLARRLQSMADFKVREKAKWREPEVLHALFGDDYQSLLSVFDAPVCDAAPEWTLRDGVEIDQATGIAEDQRKFNLEVVPKGTRFQLEFWIQLYEQNPFSADRSELLRHVRTMLEGFSADNGIRLGRRTRKGFGRGECSDWRVFHFPMATGLDDWLEERWTDKEWAAANEKGLSILGQPISEERRRFFTIDAKLAVKTSLLVRTTPQELDTPDFQHLTEGGHAILPGSSAGGALRARISSIARRMLGEQAAPLLEAMLGPQFDAKEKNKLTAGRLWVEENVLENGTTWVQGRNSIDRFTGGTADTALFTEAAWWPAQRNAVNYRFQASLELAGESDEVEAALLMQAFKDLWLGTLAIGGEASGGRGVFQGMEATLRYPGLADLTLRRGGEAALKQGGEAIVEVECGPSGADSFDAWAKLGSKLQKKREVLTP